MFFNDVLKKEECRSETLKVLRQFGVRSAPKKFKQQSVKRGRKIFKVPLSSLSTVIVTLKTGQQLPVPKLVHELCSKISGEVHTEGIFRKEGSKAKQNEIKLILDNGGRLESSIHVIDLACILKLFLRELPEAVIPVSHHDVFLHSTLLEDQMKTKAIILSCLLLPVEHLNLLVYVMQFFNLVADHSAQNKMTVANVAIVIGPAIFPIDEKLSPAVIQARTVKICEIIQILIENAYELGVLPENIIEQLGSNDDKKNRRRRSGSLTRMFNGLRKIVGAKSIEESYNVVIPDLLLTPINNNAKKRKIQSKAISYKKKKELLHTLPDNALLNIPFTPLRTPVSMDLSGHDHPETRNDLKIDKKTLWFTRNRSIKTLKKEETTTKRPGLERRWSAVATDNLKKLKRNTLTAASFNQKVPEPDYIRVSKTEYEDIKNRVSAMEKRISIEIESVQLKLEPDSNSNSKMEEANIQTVQTVYEQTLKSTQLSPSTDQLAKRLSRELKIRRSAEHTMIRSPSARKIGSMRRKSRELEKNIKLSRHQSWHVTSTEMTSRRKFTKEKFDAVPRPDSLETKEMKTRRHSSFGNRPTQNISCNLSGSSTDTWMSADGFFTTLKSCQTDNTSRASIAKLRDLNAGMVLAKAKLFDKLTDSNSSTSSLITSIPRAKIGNKIGSNRAVKYEDKRAKKNVSPRKRQLSQKQKLHIARQYMECNVETNSDKENISEIYNISDKNLNVPLKDCNRIDPMKVLSPKYSTPRITPQIKRSLHVKSPKRLCRTPGGMQRTTPLKVLKVPMHNI